MTAVFADTSYWIALTNVQDADHEKAEAFSASLRPRPVLTTEAVLIEYLNYFAGWGPRFRRAAAAAVQAMMDTGAVLIVAHSEQAFQAGLALYHARPDKGYSLTDCISMRRKARHSKAKNQVAHSAVRRIRDNFQFPPLRGGVIIADPTMPGGDYSAPMLHPCTISRSVRLRVSRQPPYYQGQSGCLSANRFRHRA